MYVMENTTNNLFKQLSVLHVSLPSLPSLPALPVFVEYEHCDFEFDILLRSPDSVRVECFYYPFHSMGIIK